MKLSSVFVNTAAILYVSTTQLVSLPQVVAGTATAATATTETEHHRGSSNVGLVGLRGGGGGLRGGVVATATSSSRKLSTSWQDIDYACTPCQSDNECPVVNAAGYVEVCNLEYGMCQAQCYQNGELQGTVKSPDDCMCKLHAECSSNYCEVPAGNGNTFGTCVANTCDEATTCSNDSDCAHLYDASDGTIVLPFCIPLVNQCGKKQYMPLQGKWKWLPTQEYGCSCTAGDGVCESGNCAISSLDISNAEGGNIENAVGTCDHKCYAHSDCPLSKSCVNNSCIEYCEDDSRCPQDQKCYTSAVGGTNKCHDTCLATDFECSTMLGGDNIHTHCNTQAGVCTVPPPPTDTVVKFKNVDEGRIIVKMKCLDETGNEMAGTSGWKSKTLDDFSGSVRKQFTWSNKLCNSIKIKIEESWKFDRFENPQGNGMFTDNTAWENIVLTEHNSAAKFDVIEEPGNNNYNYIIIPTDFVSRGKNQGCLRYENDHITFKADCSP